jgi:heme-degrading monooxygenase HmoA
VTHFIVGRFRPENYEAWRAFHGRHLDLVTSAGVVSDRICRDVEDPERIVVIVEVDDFERYAAFAASPEFQAMAQSSPVVGDVEFMTAEVIEQPVTRG